MPCHNSIIVKIKPFAAKKKITVFIQPFARRGLRAVTTFHTLASNLFPIGRAYPDFYGSDLMYNFYRNHTSFFFLSFRIIFIETHFDPFFHFFLSGAFLVRPVSINVRITTSSAGVKTLMKKHSNLLVCSETCFAS